MIHLYEIPVLFLTLGVSMWYTKVLLKMERRQNLVELDDPMFKYVPRLDTSVPIFVMLYTGTALSLGNWYAWSTLHVCFAFIHLMIARSLVLWLFPLLGPKSMFPLKDPVIDHLLGVAQPLLNDVGVSGHVGTLCIYGWFQPEYRGLFLALAALTTFCMVSSRVHYTADCVMAVPFSYTAYRSAFPMAQWWLEQGDVFLVICLGCLFILLSWTLETKK